MWEDKRFDFYQKLYDEELARNEEVKNQRNLYFGFIQIFYVVLLFFFQQFLEYRCNIPIILALLNVLTLGVLCIYLVRSTYEWIFTFDNKTYGTLANAEHYKDNENNFENHYRGYTDDEYLIKKYVSEDMVEGIIQGMIDSAKINKVTNDNFRTQINSALKRFKIILLLSGACSVFYVIGVLIN